MSELVKLKRNADRVLRMTKALSAIMLGVDRINAAGSAIEAGSDAEADWFLRAARNSLEHATDMLTRPECKEDDDENATVPKDPEEDDDEDEPKREPRDPDDEDEDEFEEEEEREPFELDQDEL